MKIYVLFADLKTAFNRVDRNSLLRRYEIKKQLIRRLERIYENTKIAVKTNKNLSEKFHRQEKELGRAVF